MRYNVLELRQTADLVNKAAEKVRGAGEDSVERVRGGLSGVFRGEAADALDHELSSLRSDLRQLAGGLTAIGNELMDYARRLEKADRDSAAYIKRK